MLTFETITRLFTSFGTHWELFCGKYFPINCIRRKMSIFGHNTLSAYIQGLLFAVNEEFRMKSTNVSNGKKNGKRELH